MVPIRPNPARAERRCRQPGIRMLATGRLHVRRAKNGSPSVHPMQGDEIRALRRLQRERGVISVTGDEAQVTALTRRAISKPVLQEATEIVRGDTPSLHELGPISPLHAVRE
jgi:hypothetical protein